LTPIQKLLKSELEISPEENSKSRLGEKRRSAGSQTVGQSIIINSNHFVTEVVRGWLPNEMRDKILTFC